ncbi:MAG: hypothetical protein PHN74_02345 [Candidatus Pacebacteria bacterium]|nr:hypothetical protein [Candidatus Paceibacterota bacterium]
MIRETPGLKEEFLAHPLVFIGIVAGLALYFIVVAPILQKLPPYSEEQKEKKVDCFGREKDE